MPKVNLLDGSGVPRRSDLKLGGLELSVVTDDHSMLSDSQKFLVKFFERKTGGKRLARRDDFDPMEITKYLPYIALFELDIKDKGKINNIKIRLVGTALANFYGEWTGHELIGDERESSIQQAHPETHNRILVLTEMVLKKKKPIILYCDQVSDNRSHWQIKILAIPFSRNGTEVDMLFTCSELINSLGLSS